MTPEEQAAADAAAQAADLVGDEPVQTTEQIAAAKEEAAGFAEGFNDELGQPAGEVRQDAPKEKLERSEETVVVAEEKKDETPPPKEEVAEQPKLATLTEAQLNELVTKVSSIDALQGELKKFRDESAGRFGSMVDTLKKVQESTAAGQQVVVTAEDIAEFTKEFPDLGEKLARDLTKVMSKLKGTGQTVPVAETPEAFAARVAPIVETHVAQERVRIQQELAYTRLADKHPDWLNIVGPKDSTTEFRTWLKGKGEAEEMKFLSSWDPNYVSTTIDNFKKEKVKPKPVVVNENSRTKRLEESVTPKGGGSTPPAPKEQTVAQAFAEGFNE